MTRKLGPKPRVAASWTIVTKIGPTEKAAPTPSSTPSHRISLTAALHKKEKALPHEVATLR
jgi:hypothetical protein